MNLPQGPEIVFLVVFLALLVALVMWWVRPRSPK